MGDHHIYFHIDENDKYDTPSRLAAPKKVITKKTGVGTWAFTNSITSNVDSTDFLITNTRDYSSSISITALINQLGTISRNANSFLVSSINTNSITVSSIFTNHLRTSNINVSNSLFTTIATASNYINTPRINMISNITYDANILSNDSIILIYNNLTITKNEKYVEENTMSNTLSNRCSLNHNSLVFNSSNTSLREVDNYIFTSYSYYGDTVVLSNYEGITRLSSSDIRTIKIYTSSLNCVNNTASINIDRLSTMLGLWGGGAFGT